MSQLPTNNPLQTTASDEELILRRNAVLQEVQNPKFSALKQAAMYLPAAAAGGAAFFGMHKLGNYLKSNNKLTSGLAKFSFGASKFLVAGLTALTTFGIILRKTIVAHMEKTGEAFTEVNGQIGQRIGKTAEEVGLEPITAADMQRMKEAHQSGAAVGQHTERAAAEPPSIQQAI